MYAPFKSPDPQTAPRPAWNTLEALAAWLETKNPDEEYCWLDYGECLLGQYAAFVGLPVGRGYTPYSAALRGFWNREGSGCAVCNIAGAQPHTFGAALARTRAEIAQAWCRDCPSIAVPEGI